MIFQIFGNLLPLDIFIIILLCASCISLYLTGFFFIFKSKNQDKIVKKYLFGIGLFFLFYGIYRTILFLFDMTFKPTPTWQITSIELEIIFQSNPELTLIYDIIWRIATAIAKSGLIFMIYVLELHIMKKKYEVAN